MSMIPVEFPPKDDWGREVEDAMEQDLQALMGEENQP